MDPVAEHSPRKGIALTGTRDGKETRYRDVQPKPWLPGLHSYNQNEDVLGTGELLVDLEQDAYCPNQLVQKNTTMSPHVPGKRHSGTEENDSCHRSGGT